MPSAPTNLENRVRLLFSLYRFKLFHKNGDYIACYGQPAVSEDGWIINLPAPDFFEGDYQSLPFETELSATMVHKKSIIKQPLAKYISRETYEEDWRNKAIAAGMPKYFHPDLFRDVASILSNQNQPSLAICFITAARELRPKGPVICKMFEELTKQCERL